MPRHFLHNNGENARGKNKPQRERIFNIPPVILGFFLLCCLCYFLPAYCFPPAGFEAFYAFFGFVPVLFLHNHDALTQLSAVSYSFLHGNFTHLGLNMLWFVIFGTPLANRLGSVFFIIFWLFTAFAAALVYCLVNPGSEASLIGASGAISGMMGAAARYNFQAVGGAYAGQALLSIKDAVMSRAVLVALGSFVALNLLTALDQWTVGFISDGTSIAWEAHLGGLLAGFLGIGQFEKWTHNFKN